MKKVNYLLIALLSVISISCNIENKKETKTSSETKIKVINEKKTKKSPNTSLKKGIEHMADYQKEIRKPIDAEKSTYKNGYLIEEFKKARKRRTPSKSAKEITAVFTERGPANVPGRTRGIAVDPTDANRWFFGTVGGGVWLTEDAGTTFTNITDSTIPNLATSTIVISPQDKNTLYVGTGEPYGNLGAIGGSGVYKTTDGGATWTNLPNTANFGDVGRIILNPTDKNNVLVGTTSGIYRTTDGGATWSQTYVSSDTVEDLDADPTDFNIQYGSVGNFGIVKSTDGGLTWSTSFDRANFNPSHGRFELAVSAADSNYIYLSVYSASGGTYTNTDFYVSSDKGESYTKLTTTSPNANLVTGQGWYDNIIMAHPYDVNTFYVGGVAVFKVTVTGTTFSFQSIASGYDSTQINDEVHVDQHGMSYILGSNQEFRILLANDGGVYSTDFSVNPGAIDGSWSATVAGKNSTQFYAATKQNGEDNYIAGAQDNGSWISSGDNSSITKSYQKILGGDGFEAVWHYNKPGNFIVASQNYGNIGRYIDYNGALTSFDDSGNGSLSPFYSKLSNVDNNPNVVFAISTNGVWRSTDFGGFWRLSSISNNFAPSASSALNVESSTANPNIVWAGAAMTESGSYVMHVSQDNGQTFSATGVYDNPNGDQNLFITGIAPSYTEANRAYVSFASQGAAKILKTEDLGQTWTDISGFANRELRGFPDVAVHCVLEMPFDENVIWAGTDIGIVETLDGGTTWNMVNGFIPVATYDLRIVNDQVVISTYGRGVWSATVTELASYTLPAYLVAPDVALRQKGIDDSSTIVEYNATVEDVTRAKFFVDDVEVDQVIQDYTTGVTYTFETAALSEGTHKIGVQLFDDNVGLETGIAEEFVNIINFNAPASNVNIAQFEESDVYTLDGGFKIDNALYFTEDVLNSAEHPYVANKTYTTILKQPLVISQGSNTLTYTDVAIVEPYTDNLADLTSFYDYVTIEASTDLQNWVTLDKYDARRYSDWLSTYNDPFAVYTDNLFKTQTINLIDKGLVAGQTVVFRFRLVTDAGVNSYGWAIKSINAATASVQDVIDNKELFAVYPTVSNGNFTIYAGDSFAKTKIKIYDVSGREAYNSTVDFSSQKEKQMSINLNAGMYILNLIDDKGVRTSKKIIIQ
ncbi:T9SS type A sorting domain-containing protein [Polaribacter sp. P097]|uniref:T9SS type A sorting domain-containing protein n=1 Tax=Polaribacter sp. P097 TaxID=3117398 RepID=UPI002FE1BABE